MGEWQAVSNAIIVLAALNSSWNTKFYYGRPHSIGFNRSCFFVFHISYISEKGTSYQKIILIVMKWNYKPSYNFFNYKQQDDKKSD